MIISSWGRLSSFNHNPHYFHDSSLVVEQILNTGQGIAYGMGRSYGDVCLNPEARLWVTTGLDRFRSFDEKTGRLICESGVLLGTIQRQFIPRGWSLPVTPGTQMVTVGGAIANDVHGKNHSSFGSFGNHILSLKLVRTDGTIVNCSPSNEPGLFAATIGGIGLTGIIIEAEILLRKVDSAWLSTELIPYQSVDELFELAQSSINFEHTVAWLDCLGQRGLFMRANWDKNPKPFLYKEPKLRAPNIPILDKISPKLFNSLYFHLSKRNLGSMLSSYLDFFYPLDKLLAWNSLYGSKGFFQYQCLIPELALSTLLKEISKAKLGCFLAVVKWFGPYQASGLMSFPKPGLTLSLDFPNKGIATEKLFSALDAIVSNYGGSIYLAKDARMSSDLFLSSYPKLNEFVAYRDQGLSSAMSRRLLGD